MSEVRTALWSCPICDAAVPLAFRWRRWPRRSLTATPSTWADLHAHIWSHEEEQR